MLHGYVGWYSCTQIPISKSYTFSCVFIQENMLLNLLKFVELTLLKYYYSVSALIAVQTAVQAREILSVCLSVRPSFRHIPMFCSEE